MAPKTIFEFLFSLPVGRIAVSPHIRNYFKKNYYQKTVDIFNGINIVVGLYESSSTSSLTPPKHLIENRMYQDGDDSLLVFENNAGTRTMPYELKGDI